MADESNSSVQVSTPAYQRVSRARTELNIVPLAVGPVFPTRSGCGFGRIRSVSVLSNQTEQVAGPSARVKKRNFSRTINFTAQAINVHLDQIGKRVELFVPHVFGYFGAADYTIRIAN